MTEKPKGLLLAMMEPPSALDEEFNDWYDLEHLPERAAIPGFETALRFVCVDGFPRYLALYDLAHLGVLDEPAYQAVAYANFSPWTKRIQARTRGRYRALATQVHPGRAVTNARVARLTLLRFRDAPPSSQGAIIEGMQRNFATRAETLQVRVFRNEIDGRTDFLGLTESQAPQSADKVDLAAFGPGRAHLDLVNSYVPYWRQG